LAKEQTEIMNESIQVAINPQTALNTHERINTVYSGEILKLESGYAKVHIGNHEVMRADEVGLVHGGFIFSAADFAAMVAVNEPNVVLASSQLSLSSSC
jgi:acyl-coenzyme A thioesterase PaaI-like protein